ncbi:hypothetical protein Tco_0500772 [Tanacetum coccineum]
MTALIREWVSLRSISICFRVPSGLRDMLLVTYGERAACSIGTRLPREIREKHTCLRMRHLSNQAAWVRQSDSSGEYRGCFNSGGFSKRVCGGESHLGCTHNWVGLWDEGVAVIHMNLGREIDETGIERFSHCGGVYTDGEKRESGERGTLKRCDSQIAGERLISASRRGEKRKWVTHRWTHDVKGVGEVWLLVVGGARGDLAVISEGFTGYGGGGGGVSVMELCICVEELSGIGMVHTDYCGREQEVGLGSEDVGAELGEMDVEDIVGIFFLWDDVGSSTVGFSKGETVVGIQDLDSVVWIVGAEIRWYGWKQLTGLVLVGGQRMTFEHMVLQ